MSAYSNKCRHEAEVVKLFQSRIPKDTLLIVGDFSPVSMKGTTTPKGVGLLRLLRSAGYEVCQVTFVLPFYRYNRVLIL
jgi:hypothetical protein